MELFMVYFQLFILQNSMEPLNSRDTFDEGYGEIIFAFASNGLF